MENSLQARLDDLKSRTFLKNIVSATQFLDPAEIAESELFLRRSGVSFALSGGCEGVERKRLFFLPDYLDEETFTPDEYISAICIRNSFGTLTHRDYLGSLMGLGIKRETLGDILVFDGYAYILATPQIARYIVDNLEKIGRYSVKCEICSLSEVVVAEPSFDEVSGTVASLRADALTSLAFGISRTVAADMIRDGKLSLNHLELLNSSSDIREGDLLSLRGFGRAKLFEIGGTSKKGRHFVTFRVFSKK